MVDVDKHNVTRLVFQIGKHRAYLTYETAHASDASVTVPAVDGCSWVSAAATTRVLANWSDASISASLVNGRACLRGHRKTAGRDGRAGATSRHGRTAKL